MTTLKTMPSETVAELVEQIESAVRLRDFYWKLADGCGLDVREMDDFNHIAAQHDDRAAALRDDLRLAIGCVDPYRLANAIGA